MNLRRKVWLPPDGDPRLVRLQQELALRSGRHQWTIVPPYLEMDEVPREPLATGAWVWENGLPGLEALVAGVRVGLFRFEPEPAPPWTDGERQTLPPPPAWKWRRGRLAVLNLTWDEAWLWSWQSSSGWSAQPRQ